MLKKIGDKTFPEWEQTGENIGNLNEQNVESIREAGVFFIKRKSDQKIVYIGQGTEVNNGGLRKRLMDFIRESDSARDHYAGQMIHDNINDIEVEVIKMGTDDQAALNAAELKKVLVKRYSPIWNK